MKTTAYLLLVTRANPSQRAHLLSQEQSSLQLLLMIAGSMYSDQWNKDSVLSCPLELAASTLAVMAVRIMGLRMDQSTKSEAFLQGLSSDQFLVVVNQASSATFNFW